MTASRIARSAISAAVALIALAGCKKADENASTEDTTRTAGGQVDSAARAAANSTSVAPSGGWTDASVLGYMVAANDGEISLGKLGATKATGSAVKAFAREMIKEHTVMLGESRDLAGKVGATADTAVDRVHDLMEHVREEVKELTDKEASADWDKNYLDKMISDHEQVLEHLKDAAQNTANADLRAALEKASGKVQHHLTKAQDLRKGNATS
jgi:putative membrane protein